jgi:hypothetical protein
MKLLEEAFRKTLENPSIAVRKDGLPFSLETLKAQNPKPNETKCTIKR